MSIAVERNPHAGTPFDDDNVSIAAALENVSVPAVVPAIWGNAVETGAAAAAGAAAAVTVIVAVALFMVSLTEVAVSVTVAGFGTAVGAL